MPFFDHYPYTNLHNVNLDWVLQAVKNWGAMVEQNNQNFIDLNAANEAFKEYVTSYITNLDVQEEINNKLDQMLASGALTQYFAPYIKTDVEDWLEENITPTTPAIDASLSIAGAAADAKATGDRITAVEESISDVVDSELENINNAIYTLSDYVGAPYQRKVITSDLTSNQGTFIANSDGDIICTGQPDTTNGTIISFGNITGLLYYDADEIVNGNHYGPRISRICLSDNAGHGYKQFTFLTSGYLVTGVGQFFTGAIIGGSPLTGVVTPFNFPTGEHLKSVIVRKESDRFTFTIKDTADNVYNIAISYSQIGITYDEAYIHLANISSRFESLLNHSIVNNVMVTVPGSGEVIDQTNPMFRKNWAVYGDSYTAPSQTIRKYPEIICEQTGCEFSNYAISGHKASEILGDMTDHPATTDDTIITVFLGYNDYADSTPLATFTANLETIISKAMEFNINANIGIIATTSCGAPAPGATGDCTAPNSVGLNLEDYVDAIVTTCHDRMVSVLDLYHEGQFYGTIAAFKAIYLNSGDGYLHPTQAGQIRIAGVIKKWMLYELVLD